MVLRTILFENLFVLHVSAAHISRKHFKLIRTDIGGKIYWSIEDINSSMGTYLNGHRIPNKEPLSKFSTNFIFKPGGLY